MGKKLSEVKRFSDGKKWEDDIEWFSFPDERMVLVRIVGEVEVLARHWIRTMSGKMFPAWCPRLNEEEEYDHTRPCPAHADFEDKAQKVIIGNAIIRQMQERGDPNPVKGVMLSHVVIDDLMSIAELIGGNPSDEDKGVDLAIKYSSKGVGAKKWSIQRGDTTPLTAEERKYRFYQFGNIIPQFQDPEVAAQYAKTMKEAMARHKYYVTPEGRVPQNARDPFKYFRGDARGAPWTDFAVLVDYRNAEKGEGAASYRVSSRGQDNQEETLYDEAERSDSGVGAANARAADTPARAAERAQAPARADSADGADASGHADDGRDDAGRGVSGADSGRGHEVPAGDGGGGGHPDGLPSIQHPTHGTVPECFAQYSGVALCTRCPVRAKCIDATDDEDM